MAAIMRRGRCNRRGPGVRIDNRYVHDRGRAYRICYMNGRPAIVELRGLHLHRALDPDGRRARQLIRLVQDPPS